MGKLKLTTVTHSGHLGATKCRKIQYVAPAEAPDASVVGFKVIYS